MRINAMSKGDDILTNKLRKLIYNQIVSYPGVSYKKLKDIFELTDNALKYHLNYLEKNKKISSSQEKGSTCRYFPHPSSVTIPERIRGILESYKLTPIQERILEYIIRYPGINQKELVGRTGMNRFKIKRNIKSLKVLNLVKNHRYGNTVCYEYIPDVELKFSIMKELMLKLLNNEIDEETFLKVKKKLEK
jgi:predicted transcriptional regulator